MRPTAFILPCLLVLLSCDGHDEHDHPRGITGEQLYVLHCASCHQVDGAGVFLRGAPPLSQTQLSYRQLVERIRGHVREERSRMPVFTTMPKVEAEKIAVHIRQKLVSR